MSDVTSLSSSPAATPSSLSGHALVALDRIDTSNTAGYIKSVIGGTSLVTLLLGIRSAWKHSRQPEAADLAAAQLFSGAAFAGKALGVATVITVSGFTLFIVGVSAILQVNSPRQFGSAMKTAFGDSIRLPQSAKSQSFEEFINSIETKTGVPPSTTEQKQ
ncbi:Transmembrane protein 242 [Caenorhabditis elegans]|uniref:Transmembrane protein 242 n=1 Tax=Caenorhabditis elegans TaxID=6239 RepID=D5MNM9_CAEEL|nr:Transmembrane protein 242 [Caenorhabditis elegans]CAB54229.1 Transmembrane protein 242 [Caenorhabditis elegans]|eukprot:NP_492874.1 Uncharacterized protein CELE_F28D9.4 [Caenorhabditis elegans]